MAFSPLTSNAFPGGRRWMISGALLVMILVAGDLVEAHVWDSSAVATLDAGVAKFAARGIGAQPIGLNDHSQALHKRLTGHLVDALPEDDEQPMARAATTGRGAAAQRRLPRVLLAYLRPAAGFSSGGIGVPLLR